MKGWWPFDDLSAGVAEELIYGNVGGPVGGVTPLFGEYVDNSACFDGSTAYIDVPNDPAIDIGTEDFSVDFWVRPDSNVGTQVIMDKRAGGIGYHVFLFGGDLGIQLADAGGFTNWLAGAPLPVNQWSFCAITVRRAGLGTFYVDGVPVSSFNPATRSGSLSNPSDFRFGARSGFASGYLDACLDEFELFKRVLDPLEVAALYAADTSGKCKDLCLSDLDGDGVVGFTDLVLILGSWGPCPDACCPQDLDGNGVIGFPDLIIVLGDWGPCS